MKLGKFLGGCLWAGIIFQSACGFAATLPLPQKLSGARLQRQDCVVNAAQAEESFAAYIEEFVLTDKQAGISLYSCVNWQSGFLKAEGVGKKQAARAAELVARNNALKTLIGLNVNAATTLQSYFERQAQIRLKIQDVLIKGAATQNLPADPEKPDEARVMVTIPFYGVTGLTSFFLDDQEIYLQAPAARTNTGTAPAAPTPEKYTGIVIDARRLMTLEPAMFPQIVSEQGEILYTASQVAKEILATQGMVEYLTGKEQKTAARSGPHPLTIKPLLLAEATDRSIASDAGSLLAQLKSRKRQDEIVVQAAGAAGQIPVNVVVSVADAQKIKQVNDAQHVDQQGQYTILIGGKIGGTEGKYPDSFFASGKQDELERLSVRITLPNRHGD